MNSSLGLTQWKIRIEYCTLRPICSRYTPGYHVICSIICRLQEDASGCHVKNSSKSESERDEMGETMGRAPNEVVEAGDMLAMEQRGLTQERLDGRICRRGWDAG